jgi:hypothetical protein
MCDSNDLAMIVSLAFVPRLKIFVHFFFFTHSFGKRKVNEMNFALIQKDY